MKQQLVRFMSQKTFGFLLQISSAPIDQLKERFLWSLSISLFKSTFPSIYLSICLSIYLPTYLPTYLSIYLSIYLLAFIRSLTNSRKVRKPLFGLFGSLLRRQTPQKPDFSGLCLIKGFWHHGLRNPEHKTGLSRDIWKFIRTMPAAIVIARTCAYNASCKQHNACTVPAAIVIARR